MGSVFLPGHGSPTEHAQFGELHIAKERDQLVDRLCQALNWVIDRKEQNQKTCAIRTEI
jgi:hypothetical protein